MTEKKFFLTADKFENLINMGLCIATDKITIEGKPVRFMYREKGDNAQDSGWRFMSGYESDEYMNNAANHGIYSVNTIANYDRTILPHLNAPQGSVFEKLPGKKDFIAVHDYFPPD